MGTHWGFPKIKWKIYISQQPHMDGNTCIHTVYIHHGGSWPKMSFCTEIDILACTPTQSKPNSAHVRVLCFQICFCNIKLYGEVSGKGRFGSCSECCNVFVVNENGNFANFTRRTWYWMCVQNPKSVNEKEKNNENRWLSKDSIKDPWCWTLSTTIELPLGIFQTMMNTAMKRPGPSDELQLC